MKTYIEHQGKGVIMEIEEFKAVVKEYGCVLSEDNQRIYGPNQRIDVVITTVRSIH